MAGFTAKSARIDRHDAAMRILCELHEDSTYRSPADRGSVPRDGYSCVNINTRKVGSLQLMKLYNLNLIRQ
jgi:hypothetical protein